VGIVVIGRNEGERLARSLDALRGTDCPIVYVDSRSSDGSVALATTCGIPVHVLDDKHPLNAARARNEGFAWLLERHPELRLVQFVDGDTALAPGWLDKAGEALHGDERLGVVAGHLGERQAGRSVFHLLAALEWRRTPGPIEATGGTFMARAGVFAEAGGFDGNVPAGEEADLCMRIRARGFEVHHVDAEMGIHDMGGIGLRMWWLRNLRTGHGYAQGAGAGRYRREARSALSWGIALPVLALGCAWPTRGWSLLLLLAFPVQMARVYRAARVRGWTRRESRCYGFFTVLAKAPEALGVVRYAGERLRGAAPLLVRYK
jgi:glycosyltransferase involved in cell wall biosynthesis